MCTGYHITEWELVELSAVPVPANPEALTRELRNGAIRAPALRKALGELLATGTQAERPQAPTDSPGAHQDSTSKAADKGRTEKHVDPPVQTKPEISTRELVRALFPALWKALREWAGRAAEREIRRRQGRVN